MTVTACSPLRYPGGKQILADLLGALITENSLEGTLYAEPYAGGGGAALKLLFDERVSQILLNDKDRSIYACWKSVLNETNEFVRLVRTARLNIQEWRRQKHIYQHPTEHSMLELGFATFYLNRT